MENQKKTYPYKALKETGIEILGGEAQQLALARVLYKGYSVVILGEPTAIMDLNAENSMFLRFNSFAKNKTAIYISYRLSNCSFRDNVAVINKAKHVKLGYMRLF